MESSDDGLESEANVRPRPRLTGAGQPRGCPGARWTAIDRGLSRDPLAQARLNRSAKGAGTGHSPRYPKSGTTQSDRLLGVLNCRNPTLAAHQFMGVLNEFSLWPLMLGRQNLGVPTEEIVEETIQMFLQHYRRPKERT